MPPATSGPLPGMPWTVGSAMAMQDGSGVGAWVDAARTVARPAELTIATHRTKAVDGFFTLPRLAGSRRAVRYYRPPAGHGSRPLLDLRVLGSAACGCPRADRRPRPPDRRAAA